MNVPFLLLSLKKTLRVLKNSFLSVVRTDFKARIVVELESLRLIEVLTSEWLYFFLFFLFDYLMS